MPKKKKSGNSKGSQASAELPPAQDVLQELLQSGTHESVDSEMSSLSQGDDQVDVNPSNTVLGNSQPTFNAARVAVESVTLGPNVRDEPDVQVGVQGEDYAQQDTHAPKFHAPKFQQWHDHAFVENIIMALGYSVAPEARAGMIDLLPTLRNFNYTDEHVLMVFDILGQGVPVKDLRQILYPLSKDRVVLPTILRDDNVEISKFGSPKVPWTVDDFSVIRSKVRNWMLPPDFWADARKIFNKGLKSNPALESLLQVLPSLQSLTCITTTGLWVRLMV